MAGFVHDDVMASKRGKLLINLGNALEASLGRGNDRGDWPERVRAEAEGVLRAAGLSWDDVGMDMPRRKELMQMGDVPGEERFGGSTSQSLVRATGRVETDYLNGEIAWLARLQGMEAPLNAFMTDRDGQLGGAWKRAGRDRPGRRSRRLVLGMDQGRANGADRLMPRQMPFATRGVGSGCERADPAM
jgi:hypothetical protein